MLTLINAWVTALTLLGGMEQARFRSRVEASSQVQRGDDEQKVLATLGKPVWRPSGFLLLFSGRRWAYGTTLDLGELWPADGTTRSLLPVRLRLLAPDEDDLVIVWDRYGKVESVVRP